MTTNDYTVVCATTDGIATLDHPRYHRQVWVRCCVKKPCRCAATGRALRQGDVAYKPITDQKNRRDRLAVAFVERWDRCK